MVAYHYPPLTGSSGVQRTFRFAQYLRDFDWQPIILTATTRAYESVAESAAQLAGVPVHRAFALDTARHLSLFGRYPGALARPDRWVSWRLGAGLLGRQLIGKYRPDVIWSTYPIATAHLIGDALARASGLPWVADFRDPMAHVGYPEEAATWQSYLAVEKKVFSRAAAASFTTPGALDFYRERYPACRTAFHLLANGYDEDDFVLAEQRRRGGQRRPVGRRLLLHSGVVYPQWRNPRLLFRALRRLLDAGCAGAAQVRIRFRASAHDAFLKQLAGEEGVMDFMEIAPELDYISALAEMLEADGLLLLQNHECNGQVPAKLYEYLRAGKPIVALTAPDGDTAAELRKHDAVILADLASTADIVEGLKAWLDAPEIGRAGRRQGVESCSRRGRTQELARILNSVIH